MIPRHQLLVQVIDVLEVCVVADGFFDGAVVAHQVCGGTAFGDGDGVFVVGGGFAVAGDDRPAIVAGVNVFPALGGHGLDGDDEAFLQDRATAALAEVWHVGRFVEAPAEAVANEFADDAVATRLLGVALDGEANVPYPLSGAGGVDA